MAISLTQFIKKYLGTKVDYDGHNGPQVVEVLLRRLSVTPEWQMMKQLIPHNK